MFMTSQKDDKVGTILTPFSRTQKDFNMFFNIQTSLYLTDLYQCFRELGL